MADRGAPPHRPLILASSVATYCLPKTDVVDVNHPQEPTDFYGETKLQNEQDIRNIWPRR
jgi:UDP-glucose 4-epimerase